MKKDLITYLIFVLTFPILLYSAMAIHASQPSVITIENVKPAMLVVEIAPNPMKHIPEPVEYFDVPLSEDLQDYIFELCREKNIDPAMIVAMIDRESKFNASVIGDSGRSHGLMQVQPKWHKARMDALGCDDLLDPYQNVTVAVDFLVELYETGKSTEWVLMAYNSGPSKANKMVALGEVSDYARTVISNSKNLATYAKN